MATLYRKYRPQVFNEAVGQNHIKVTLQNEIQTGGIAHAYLFCGPRAVGKTTFARLFAKSINCLNRKEREFEPCNKCEICNDITGGRSLDIIEVDAASHTGVDNVRENIIAGARIAPSKNKFKVFIIDEVHMLSTPAFNALLKTIEEPPKNVIFILCTTEIHKVPATIISRCERFDFRRISIDDMVKKLAFIVKKEKIKVDRTILESIARQAEGHMRDAESLLGQIVAISGNEIKKEDADLVIPRSDMGEIISLVEMLSKKDAGASISLINRLLDDGVDLEKFISDLIEVLRKIMLGKINPALEEKLGYDIGESFEMKLNDIKKNIPLPRIIKILEKFVEARIQLKSSFIMQLPIELAITELFLSVDTPINVMPTRPVAPVNDHLTANFDNPVANNPKSDLSADRIAKTMAGDLTKDKLLSRWNEFLAKIKVYNHSLSFILRVCQPQNVNGNRVCLAFKYKFHKDRINELQIKNLVEKTMNEVYGTPLIIEAIIDENLEVDTSIGPKAEDTNNKDADNSPVVQKIAEPAPAPKAEEGDGMMNDLLRTFGGKVIG